MVSRWLLCLQAALSEFQAGRRGEALILLLRFSLHIWEGENFLRRYMAPPICKGHWEGEYSGFLYSIGGEHKMKGSAQWFGVSICLIIPNFLLIVPQGAPKKFLHSTLQVNLYLGFERF